MPSEQFIYFEVWTGGSWYGTQAGGGTCKGRFLPVESARRRNVNGDNALRITLPRSNRCVPFIEKGATIREVLSNDGTVWREWPVAESPQIGAGYDTLVVVDCVPPLHLLVNYPVESTDADGHVSQETAAIQLALSTIFTSWLRARTPALIVNGTIDPTGLWEVGFSRDSALSGARRIEDLTGKEFSLEPIGTTQYGMNLTTIGAGAAPLYIRAGKQLQKFIKRGVPGMVNRLDPIRGKDGDEPGASAIAWAYWEVEAVSGSKVKLKAIHGGDGPIAFDDQFNHAGLPGGANSLYLEKRDGTYTQITDSEVATQELTVGSVTTVSVGDWVRIVASSTGKHLTFLDNPASIATYGLVAGEFETAFDDTVQIAKNALQPAWANPGSLPDGWSGVGSRTTAANEWATAGQALKMTGSRSSGTVLAAPAPRSWSIKNRRSFFSATAIIRILAAFSQPDSQLVLRLKAGSTVLGSIGYGTARFNDFVQLKMAGVDLAAYIGTTQSITGEIVLNAPTAGSEDVQLIVDSICFGPSLTARAPCEGSNGARVWQEANRYLKEKSTTLQLAYEMTAADLDQLGRPGQVPVVLGQTVHTYVDEPTLPSLITGRLLQIEDRPEVPGQAKYLIGTLPPRQSRKRAEPAELVVPFIEPIEVQYAKEDTRNAALFIAVKTPISQDATTITVDLDVRDSRGATPTVVAVATGGASIASGSGVGPWVINKPAAGAGVGRVIFTARYPGRADVTDAVDVPEQSGAALALQGLLQSTSATQMVVRVFASDGIGGATATLTYSALGLTVTPASGQTFTTISSPTGTPTTGEYVDLTITRPPEASGVRRVQCRATATGRNPGTLSIEVPDQSVPVILMVANIVSTSATQIVYRVSPAVVGAAGTTGISMQYNDNGLTVSPASGSQTASSLASIYDTPVGGQYVDFTVTRPAGGTGTKRVTFYGIKSGYWTGEVGVEVPDQSGALLVAKAPRQSSTVGSVTVRVSAADGVGGESATITYEAGGLTVSPASGQNITTMADIASAPSAGQYVDFEITKPTFGNAPSRVQFIVAKGSTKTTISVDVEAQERDTIALGLRLKLITINATTVVVRAEAVDPFPPGGASVSLAYSSTTSVTPSSPQTVTPDAAFDDSGYVDFTVDRPTALSQAARFTVSATDTTNGRIPATDSVDIPAQDPPSIEVRSERVSTTQWKLTWTATGTVTVSKNGASYVAPGSLSPAISSGTAFNRGDTDDEYTFKATAGGQDMVATVMVPAKEGTLAVLAPQFNSSSSVDIRWTASGLPSGTTFNVSWKRFDSSNVFTGTAGESLGVSGSPLNINPTGASGDRYEVSVAAVFNGRVVAQVQFYRTQVE